MRLPEDCVPVLEFGGGSGAVTRKLLQRLQSESRDAHGVLLHVFETNPFCLGRLEENLRGAPVRLLDTDAVWALKIFGKDRVDGIVSGIPYSRMKEDRRREAAIDAWLLLRPGGKFITYQVKRSIRNAMEDIFGNIDETLIEDRCPFVDPKYIFMSEKREADHMAGKNEDL